MYFLRPITLFTVAVALLGFTECDAKIVPGCTCGADIKPVCAKNGISYAHEDCMKCWGWWIHHNETYLNFTTSKFLNCLLD